MSLSRPGPLMYGEPMRLFWNGWESDTRRLAHYGWDVSAREDFNRREISIALRFSHGTYKIYGVGTPERFDHMRRFYEDVQRKPLQSNFRIQMDLAHSIQFQTYQPMPYYPVDTEPSIDFSPEVNDIKDLSWFRTVPQEKDDIIIKPLTFQELMAQALEIQAPKQKQLREKARGSIAGIIRVAV